MTHAWVPGVALLLVGVLHGLPAACEPGRAQIATTGESSTLHVARTGYAVLDGCASESATGYAWSTTVGRFYGRCETKTGLYCKDDRDCDWGDADGCLDVQDQCRAYLRDLPTRGSGRIGTVTLALDGVDCSARPSDPACARVDLSLPSRPPLRGVGVWSNLAQDYERLEAPIQPRWPAPAVVIDYLRECPDGGECHYLVGHNTPKNVPGQSEDFWREFRPVLERYQAEQVRHNESCGGKPSCEVRPDGLLLDWRFDVVFRYDEERGCNVGAVRQFPDRDWRVCGAPLGSGATSQEEAYACPGAAHSCRDTWGYFDGLASEGGYDPVTQQGALGPLGLFVPLRWARALDGVWGAEAEICSEGGRSRFGVGIDAAWHCDARRQAPKGRCFGGLAGGRECTLEGPGGCAGGGTCLEATPAAYAKTGRQIHVTAPGMLDWRHGEARRRYLDAVVYMLRKGAGLEDSSRCLALSWQGYSYVFWDQGEACGIGRVGCSNLADPTNSRTGAVLGRPGFDGGSLYPNPYGPGESEFYARGLLLAELRARLDAENLCVTIVPNTAKAMRGILPRGAGAASWDFPDPARAATSGTRWTQNDTAAAACRGGSQDGSSCKFGASACETGGGSCRLTGSPFNREAPRIVEAPRSLEPRAGERLEFSVRVEDDGRPLVYPGNTPAGLRCEYDLLHEACGTGDAPPCDERAEDAVEPPRLPCDGVAVEPSPDSCRAAALVVPERANGACVLRIQASDHDAYARVDSRSRRLVPIRVREAAP